MSHDENAAIKSVAFALADQPSHTQETQTDAQLIARLRNGDEEAYSLLWRRHIAAALFLARRFSPTHSEDLASESFIAVYNQVVHKGTGPKEAFRPYLLATVRNLSLSWIREGKMVIADPEVDAIDTMDPLSLIQDEEDAGDLLSAFKALPERWQRALWLIEVERVPRAQVAAEFQIKPNAVSALMRRARSGLRVSWLAQQTPAKLRQDPSHAAALLPAYVVSKRSVDTADRHRVESHLRNCATCSDLHVELQSLCSRMRGTTLGLVGFAALAGFIPASTASTAGAAALAVGGLSLGTAVAASIGTIVAGAGLSAALWLSGSALETNTPTPGSPVATSETQSSSKDSADTDGATERSNQAPDVVTAENDAVGVPLGRGVDNPHLPTVGFASNGPASPYVSPPLYANLPPGTLTPPSTVKDPPFKLGMNTPTRTTTYGAPIFSGVTHPGAQIGIEYRLVAHLVDTPAPYNPQAVGVLDPQPIQRTVSSDEHGNWEFDFRKIGDTRQGTFEYRIWAFLPGESSEPVTGTYTTRPPALEGIQAVNWLNLPEASTTGIVLRVTADPDAVVCLSAGFQDQRKQIQLDANGTAVVKMLFHSGGYYWLGFQQCSANADGSWTLGAMGELAVDVFDPDGPIFGGFGPDPDLESIELLVQE